MFDGHMGGAVLEARSGGKRGWVFEEHTGEGGNIQDACCREQHSRHTLVKAVSEAHSEGNDFQGKFWGRVVFEYTLQEGVFKAHNGGEGY